MKIEFVGNKNSNYVCWVSISILKFINLFQNLFLIQTNSYADLFSA